MKNEIVYKKDAIEVVCDNCPISFKDKCEWKDNGHCSTKVALETLPLADVVSREDYHNLLMASNDIDRALREYQKKEEQLSAEVVHKPDYSYEADKVRRLKEAQSVEPKMGGWIKATGMMPPEFHGHHCCSECGNFANMEPPLGNREDLSRFCPNCGARMKGGDSK